MWLGFTGAEGTHRGGEGLTPSPALTPPGLICKPWASCTAIVSYSFPYASKPALSSRPFQNFCKNVFSVTHATSVQSADVFLGLCWNYNINIAGKGKVLPFRPSLLMRTRRWAVLAGPVLKQTQMFRKTLWPLAAWGAACREAGGQVCRALHPSRWSRAAALGCGAPTGQDSVPFPEWGGQTERGGAGRGGRGRTRAPFWTFTSACVLSLKEERDNE